MDDRIIHINDITNENIKVQVGIDKNNNPVYVGDIVVEDVSYEFSSDYFNGIDDRVRPVCKHEVTKQMCSGKIYRQVTFDGTSFRLEHYKTEGYLPTSGYGFEWATQDNLGKHEKCYMKEDDSN